MVNVKSTPAHARTHTLAKQLNMQKKKKLKLISSGGNYVTPRPESCVLMSISVRQRDLITPLARETTRGGGGGGGGHLALSYYLN